MKRIALYIVIALVAASCGGRAKESRRSAPKVYRFQYVTPPPHATQQQRLLYMEEHYWDKFDFCDTTFISKVDTAEMMRAFAGYFLNFVRPDDARPMQRLIKRSAVSEPMFKYFVMLAERLFHDPNSPYRNDEQYIPVLEAQIASPYYDEYERMVPQYDLHTALQNRIGHPANDFKYTVASGRTSNLYSVRSPYTLIYINNPGCPMCREIQQAIEASPLLSRMIAGGELCVLGIYPDKELDEWRNHPLPASWVNAYDKGCVIEQKRLYDLRAIPALYLLDSRKRVLVKDSTSVAEIEAVINALSE
ncbi:MAG: DUF5106 domain-containing protein [Alistipes sp.]|nr:DUF5106 domain-containing protein [Alistipes sp.]